MAALECAQLPSRGARPSQINYRGLLMSNTNETVASLNLLAAEMSLLKHPFYQQWTAGMLSAQRLGNYAIQYYRHVEAFPRHLSALHSRCDDLETRQVLLENLIDEERGAENHPELWLRLHRFSAFNRKKVLAAEPLPAFLSLWKSAPWSNIVLISSTRGAPSEYPQPLPIQKCHRCTERVHNLAEADAAPYDPQGTFSNRPGANQLGPSRHIIHAAVSAWPHDPDDEPRPLAPLTGSGEQRISEARDCYKRLLS